MQYGYHKPMRKSDETRRIGLLQKIDSILGFSYDLNKVIRRIFKEIGKHLDTRNFYIAIYNAREDVIHFPVYTINGRERVAGSRKLGRGLTEYVMSEKKPVRINKSVRTFCRKIGVKPIGKNAQSWLGVPMIHKGNVEGVITIQDYQKPNAYSADDEKLLSSIASRAAVVIANTRLIEDEIRRSKEISMMDQIAHQLTKNLDVDKTCESVTELIRKSFPNFNVSVFVIQDKGLVVKKISRSYGIDVSRKLKMSRGEGVVGTVAKTGKTIVVNDVKKSKLYRSYGQKGSKSEIAIPLKISGHTIGALNIECSDLNAFDENSVRILEIIADRLSVALHNAQLYEEATSNAKELSVSFTIANSLISTLELDDVLKRILSSIRDSFGYSHIAILLVDKTKQELYIKAAHGYHRSIPKKLRLQISKEGICGRVAASGRMFYAPDVKKVPFYVMGKKSVRSEAALPLKIRGEIIGVLDIESDTVDAFSARDLRMFSIFASQAAVAIENARMFDEIKALSLTDSLTKAANRRHFDLMLEAELKKARGYSRPLSLAIVDLDDFKVFNDKYGHIAGDKMLIHIARTLRKNVRDTDFVARYGGEEFVIIFPETNNTTAAKVSERVRSAVATNALVLKGYGRKKMNVSIGVATYPINADSLQELILNADKALYHAKQRGKNCVETIT